MNITWLTIPKGWRQNSWLFTNATVELTRVYRGKNFCFVVRAGLEPATYSIEFRSGALTSRRRCLHVVIWS